MSGTIHSHKDLIVWQKAMDLAVAVYNPAKRLPESERYGMTAQLSRAVISVPANIPEGYARSTRRDYANFVAIAKGSLMETETYLLLSNRLKYVDTKAVSALLDLVTEISKMLTALRNRLIG